MAEQCSTCKFWEHDSDSTTWYTECIGDETEVGLCHRHPPVLVELNQDADGPAARNPMSWQHAAVEADDWCGEWKPATVAPAAPETA